ncbi:MAG: DNA repair protein RadC [Chloroflexota bacterium]
MTAKKIKELPTSEMPRNRLNQLGASALSNTELLTIVLGTGSFKYDAAQIAQNVMREFQSLTGIYKADPVELMELAGIGEAKALTVAAALELGRRMVIEDAGDKPRVTTPADMANILMADMQNLAQEHFVVLLLDSRNQVIKKETVYIGTVNSSHIRISEVFRSAIKLNAPAIGIAHNHPSGDPAPSRQDIHVTKEVVNAGKMLDIQVLDHLVIGHNRFVSMRERGLGFDV